MTDVTFSLFADFDRTLFWEGGQSVRYLAARLKAIRNDDCRLAERAPLNIALVIDASGSMNGGKLEAAKAAALGLAERLSHRDRLTLVSFAADVVVHLDALPVTEENLARIKTEIGRLETRGTTFLSGGWFAGVDCAARIAEQDDRMTPRVILLSDGHANQGITDRDQLYEHAGELRRRGVLTSALGIGNGYDEHLLRGIAENGGGRLHDAELTTEISSVLLGELEDILGTLIEDAVVRLVHPELTSVELVGSAPSVASGTETTGTLGPVQNEVERVAVFKVTCPQADLGDTLDFELSATGRNVEEGSEIRTGSRRLSLKAVAAAENGSQPRDTAVMQTVARFWSAQIVSTAAKMNNDRAFADAERYLQRELHHFRRYVEGLERGCEMVVELEMLALRVGRQLSSRMHKEMTFQSALINESRMDRRGAGKESWSARLGRGD